jgi:hypothetical protein
MKFDYKSPCSACPFRTNSLKGWLGNYTPEGVIVAIQHDQPFFCHKHVEETIGYDDPEWREKALEDAQHCAGALIFANKLCKLSRIPEVAAAQRNVDKDQKILFPPSEFVKHHTLTIERAEPKPIKGPKNGKSSRSRSSPVSKTKRKKTSL